jgi:DNA adenine methylase
VLSTVTHSPTSPPPYRPLSRTAGFTSYSRSSFGDDSQKRLAAFFARLHRTTGAALMLSNSDPMANQPPDRFFEDLYQGFNTTRVQASRAINSKATGRGRIPEIVVRNY